MCKAAREHDVSSLRHLVEVHGADVNSPPPKKVDNLNAAANFPSIYANAGWPLLNAIVAVSDQPTSTELAEQMQTIEYLLSINADVRATFERGHTALHSCRIPAVSRALIAAKADVNAQDIEGQTTLYLAATNPEFVAVLLEHHADPTITRADGLSVMELRLPGYQTVAYDFVRQPDLKPWAERLTMCQALCREHARKAIVAALQGLLTKDPAGLVAAFLLTPVPSPFAPL